MLKDGQLTSQLLARVDADGQFLCLGDSANSFTVQGETIHPGEIETALLRLEAVVDCAVTGIEDAAQGMAILAVVVLQDGVQRDEASLAEGLAALLPPAQRPSHWHQLKLMPRDAWGVVSRAELVQRFRQSSAAG